MWTRKSEIANQPIALAPGQRVAVQAVVRVSKLGEQRSGLTLSTDDPLLPRIATTMSVTGWDYIEFDRDVIDLGSMPASKAEHVVEVPIRTRVGARVEIGDMQLVGLEGDVRQIRDVARGTVVARVAARASSFEFGRVHGKLVVRATCDGIDESWSLPIVGVRESGITLSPDGFLDLGSDREAEVEVVSERVIRSVRVSITESSFPKEWISASVSMRSEHRYAVRFAIEERELPPLMRWRFRVTVDSGRACLSRDFLGLARGD